MTSPASKACGFQAGLFAMSRFIPAVTFQIHVSNPSESIPLFGKKHKIYESGARNCLKVWGRPKASQPRRCPFFVFSRWFFSRWFWAEPGHKAEKGQGGGGWWLVGQGRGCFTQNDDVVWVEHWLPSWITLPGSLGCLEKALNCLTEI